VARIAVGVAAGDDADGHLAHRLVAEAVADALAGLQVLRGDDLGGERHRRLQAELLGALVGERRAAVQHDARAHPVAARFREAQQRRGVGERALLRLQRLHQFAEPVELRPDAAGAVGVGEMRHQRDALHLRVHAQRVVGRPQPLDAETKAVHAAVHLEVDVDLALELAALQDLDLLGVVDHRRKGVLVQRREVAGLEEAFEQEDRLGHAADAQPRGLLQVEHREAVGGIERARGALDAVAVRVRLDHRPDLGVCGMAPRYCQIMCECRGRDGRADRPGHGGLLCYKAPRRKTP
jgi:hypothetical protein